MKKTNLILLVTSMLAMFSSCNKNNDSTSEDTKSEAEESVESANSSNEQNKGSAPRLSNCLDYSFDIKTDFLRVSNYDFIGNAKAIDAEDGDISDKITIKVTNHYTKENVIVIDLSTDGLFDIYYEVIDSDGNMDYDKRFITVGDPYGNLDANGNPKVFHNLSAAELESTRSTYEAIFEQDFNYEGAPGSVSTESDYNAYTYQTGGGGWGNNESQVYEKNIRTCFVADGKLNIKVIKEDGVYYSARLNTTNQFSKNWTYGKYEIVAKVPNGKGAWPAIWMMPNYSSYGGWPKSGEIDIMETSQYYFSRIIGTVHTESYNHIKGTQKSGGINDSTIYSQYHKYSIEWLPDRIIFMFDDQAYFTFMPNNYSSNVSYAEWPYDKPFHFIFNVAMGGNMGGEIASDILEKNDVTLSIDSIKVYQSSYIKENYIK